MAASFPNSNNAALHQYYNGYNHIHGVNGGNLHSEEGDKDNDSHDAHHEHAVQGDPAMRADLEHMINGGYNGGTFGTFGLLPAHGNTHDLSQLPHGSIAYAQASGSADSVPPPLVKEKPPRSKVSRACDECRRKKIRCDATDETGAAPCTSCARAGLRCAFSRQQLKRGPSKGYIKDLAERLQQLEQQVQDPSAANAQLQGDLRRTVQQADSRQGTTSSGGLPAEPRTGDKRLFSATEEFSPHSSWDGASSVVSLPLQGQLQQQSSPTQSRSQPFWRLSGNNIQELTTVPYDHAVLDTAAPTITNFDWDEDVINEYYRLIHQTFPLLPNSKTRLRHRLAELPVNLRDAFLGALDCLTRTFPTSSLRPTPQYPQTLKRAAESLAKYPFDNPSTHTPATNLAYLQTLLLMAIETDNHGPATIRGQAGPSRAEWLGRAAGVAGQLEINIIRSDPASSTILNGDRDSEDRLARRVWWVLFILDRWHASSTADLLKLPENSVVLLPDDQILLGESTYHLARLSFIIGHLAAILTTTKTPSTDVMAPSNPASSLLTLTLAGEIDRFRESVESVWGSFNLVHLSYHHVHLLIKRLNPLTEPHELVGHAVKVAAVLNSKQTPLTPLNHHFAALSAMTLCELVDVRSTRAQAIRGLVDLRSCLGGGLGLAGHEGSEGWDGAVRELVVTKLERIDQNTDTDRDERAFDPTMITRYGYLTALAQGMMKIT